MNEIIKATSTIILAIVMGGVLGMLLAFPIQWTWNATMPNIFELVEITWKQAWCLNFLASCLIQSHISHNRDS